MKTLSGNELLNVEQADISSTTGYKGKCFFKSADF